MALPTASDNKFPKVIVTEGAAPSSPSAGDFKLYVDSADHLFKMKNSSGTVTTFGTGLADPMTTRGDIIIRNSSNSTARLGVGASGTVLSSDGTDVSWQTPAGGGGGGGLVFLEAHTASSSATLDFTTFISGTYDDYMLELTNIIPATNATNLLMAVSTDGGSTWNSSTIYNWSYNFLNMASSAAGNVNGAGDTLFHLANANSSTTSRGGVSGKVYLFAPGNSSADKIIRNDVMQPNSGDTSIYNYSGGGWWGSSTAVNAVQFKFSSGNIASGTIRAYGYAKS